MKVLLDMNLSPRWATFLRQEGIEAVHWSGVGNPRASDAEIAGWARQNGFVIFSHDLDFSALLAATGDVGPSIIQVRTQDVTPDAIGRDVVRILRLRSSDIERGAIVSLDKIMSRVKILPIRRDPSPSARLLPEINGRYHRSAVDALFPGLHPRRALNARADRIILMLLEENEGGYVNGFDKVKRQLWMQFNAGAGADNAVLKSGIPACAFFKRRGAESYQFLGEITLLHADDNAGYFVFGLEDRVDMTSLP